MKIEQALKLTSDLFVQHSMRPLSNVETASLQGTWENPTYESIAEKTGYSSGYLCKKIGPLLWRDLTLFDDSKQRKTLVGL